MYLPVKLPVFFIYKVMSLAHIHFETQSDMKFVLEWIKLVENFKGALNSSIFLFLYDITSL
jgi:hypothetical protein